MAASSPRITKRRFSPPGHLGRAQLCAPSLKVRRISAAEGETTVSPVFSSPPLAISPSLSCAGASPPVVSADLLRRDPPLPVPSADLLRRDPPLLSVDPRRDLPSPWLTAPFPSADPLRRDLPPVWRPD
eukprot:4978476-Heterocapsa_arctica.AAC.1